MKKKRKNNQVDGISSVKILQILKGETERSFLVLVIRNDISITNYIQYDDSFYRLCPIQQVYCIHEKNKDNIKWYGG